MRKLPRPAQQQVSEVLAVLAVNPRPPGAKALTGVAGVLRVRSGSYRIAYKITDRELLVTVVAVGDRKEIYRRLR